jgi:transposase
MGKNEPISLRLTPANVHDCVPVKEMIQTLKGLEIKTFIADKAYDDVKIREALKDAHITANIPPRKNRLGSVFFDQTIYKWRWRIEAFFWKTQGKSAHCHAR